MARFLRRLALLAVLVGAAAWLKELLDRAEPTGTTAAEPAGTTLREEETADASPSAKPATPVSNGAKTKAVLYEEAQRLGIEGRSKMTKSELERAIRDA